MKCSLHLFNCSSSWMLTIRSRQNHVGPPANFIVICRSFCFPSPMDIFFCHEPGCSELHGSFPFYTISSNRTFNSSHSSMCSMFFDSVKPYDTTSGRAPIWVAPEKIANSGLMRCNRHSVWCRFPGYEEVPYMQIPLLWACSWQAFQSTIILFRKRKRTVSQEPIILPCLTADWGKVWENEHSGMAANSCQGAYAHFRIQFEFVDDNKRRSR